MPKATKRERQRINRELRREAMRKAEQRQKRFKTGRNVAIAVVIVAVVFGVLKLVQGDDSSSTKEVTCADVKASKGTDQQFASPPEMTIDQTSLYVAQMETSCGSITLALDAVTTRSRSTTSCSSPNRSSTTASTSPVPRRTS